MKILCFGAGAVGCLVSGRLAACGNNVTLMARPEPAEALRTHGLTLQTPDGSTLYARPRILTDPSELRDDEAPPDLILIAVKAYDTAAVAGMLPLVYGPATSVLSLQNGLGNEELLSAVVGEGKVVAGSFTLSVSMPQVGMVHQHTGSGGVALAEIQPLENRQSLLLSLFALAGLRVCACPDWRAMKWSKVLLNLLANASCALLEMTPAEVFADPRLFRVERCAFREACRVMRRLGLAPADLPGYPVRLLSTAMGLPAPLARPLLAPRVAGGRGDKLPSLALDLARGKGRSEVGFLNGAVARAAAECGVPAPVNAFLAETLEAVTAGRLDPGRYARNPAALLADLGRG